MGSSALPAWQLPLQCPALHCRLMPSLEGHGVPADRMLVLQGEAGDLADAGQLAGPRAKKALRWLPRGVLRWVPGGRCWGWGEAPRVYGSMVCPKLGLAGC